MFSSEMVDAVNQHIAATDYKNVEISIQWQGRSAEFLMTGTTEWHGKRVQHFAFLPGKNLKELTDWADTTASRLRLHGQLPVIILDGKPPEKSITECPLYFVTEAGFSEFK